MIRNPMRRAILYTLAALSLLLLLSTIMIWIRAQWVADWLKLHTHRPGHPAWTGYHLCTTRNGLYLSYSPFHFASAPDADTYAADPSSLPGLHHHSSEPQSATFDRGLAFLGFGFFLEFDNSDPRYSYRFDRFKIPYWFLLLLSLAGAYPAFASIRRARTLRRRTRLNLCLACGYDLRATIGPCPECGAAPATSTPIAR